MSEEHRPDGAGGGRHQAASTARGAAYRPLLSLAARPAANSRFPALTCRSLCVKPLHR
jgi:hypothetical protein